MRIETIFLISLLSIWLCVAVGGMAAMWRYSLAPGEAARPPIQWPISSAIPRQPGRFTLVMFVHPHCPCSRASIGELAQLMAHADFKLDAEVVFEREPGFSEGWARTDLWYSAKEIPGVSVILDDGSAARLFDSATSGQTMVYSPHGRLLFSGGITVARGHWGDNKGVSAVEALLASNSSARSSTPVYGCPLFAPDSKVARKTCLR